MIMHKVSTPGVRARLRAELPQVLTQLEIALPTLWQTFVIHVLGFHVVDFIERGGPFPIINMLVVERFHTVFKACARNRKASMMSILRNWQLLEVANTNQLQNDMLRSAAPNAPRKSTPASFLARPDSANVRDRVVMAKGAGVVIDLTDDEFEQVRALWAEENADYKEFWYAFAEWKMKRRNNDPRDIAGQFRTWATRVRIGPLSPSEVEWLKMAPTVQVRFVRCRTFISTFAYLYSYGVVLLFVRWRTFIRTVASFYPYGVVRLFVRPY
jgi:hypothetical protein